MAEGEEVIFGTETLWRGIAKFISRYEQYEKSLKYYDLAVATTPNDKKTLIDRARARAKCNHYEGALDDIQRALSFDENDLIALAEKAHLTFLNTRFEEALIQNHRLLPKRRKPDNFFLGILKCISTIDQCLGDIAGKPLRDHFLIIRKLAWKWNLESDKEVVFVPRNKDIKNKKKKISKHKKKATAEPDELQIRDSLHSHKSTTLVIPPLKTTVKFTPLQRFTKNIENYMSERYLERMYREKRFLKSMLKHPGLKTPNAAGSKHLKDLAKETYIKVSQKQDVIRTSRPFYFIKYQDAKITGNLKNRLEADLVLHQQNYKKEADKILENLIKGYQEKKLPVIIEMTEKMMNFAGSKPKRLLPDKDEYLHKVHDYLRKGFYQLYRLNNEQVKWDQDKRIMVFLDQPISRKPSTDSVIYQFDIGNVDISNEIHVFENRLDRAETPDEICWCYHELARYSMLGKNYELARIYCKKCLLEIENKESLEEWYLNITMILLRTNMKEQNKVDALNEARTALKIAENRRDRTLKDYLKRLIAIIKELEFGDKSGSEVTEQRQNKILALMANATLKEEFANLFRTIGALPANRRLAIVPDVYKPKGEASGMKLARGKSKSKVRLADEPTMEPTGAAFLSLIQFQL